MGHRALRALFLPRAFRAAFGSEMEEAFVLARAEARREGRGASARLWAREILDLAVTGHRLRRERRRYGAQFVARRVGRRPNHGNGGGVMGWFDDVRYAVRSLVRNPSVTLFAVMTTGLGVGAATAMFGTVESVVLNPIPYEGGDRMVSIFGQIGDAEAYVPPTVEDIEILQAQRDLFEHVEPWTSRTYTLTGSGEATEVRSALIRSSYHDVIGRPPLIGRSFDAEEVVGEGARVTMLSHSFAVRMFGRAEDALEQTLTLNGESWTVVGVMPPRTLVPGWGLVAVELWTPLADDQITRSSPTLALLVPGVTVEQANERMASMFTDGRFERKPHVTLVLSDVSHGIGGYLGLLMGAVVLLLLIACVNVSNLLLFRANSRRRETAVRAALGGGRWRLTRQMLIESLMLAFVGGAVGLAVAYVGQTGILRLRPSQLEILDIVRINGLAWAFAFGVTVLAGVLFGILPALRAGRDDSWTPLRSGTRNAGDVLGGRLRWLLVSGEVALSFALLIGSMAVLSTLVARQNTDFGYAIDEIAVVSVAAPHWRYETPEERAPVYAAIRGQLERLPGVAHVALASAAPPRPGVWFGNVQVEGQDPSEDTKILHGPMIREGYFDALGQRVVAGRAFDADDLASEEGLIMLGEGTARTFFGDENPVGRRFRVGSNDDPWLTVVGVAADVPMSGLRATEEPLQIYRPMRALGSQIAFVLRFGTGLDPAPAMAMTREAVMSVDHEMRVDHIADGRTLQYETLQREQFITTLMALFASFALVLAAVGLYGVVSQVVGQRTREIGIRIALGAQKGRIAEMVLKRAGAATLVGIVIGVALAIGGVRVLESRIVGLVETPWTTYALGAAALGLTALLAAFAPTRRATGVDPVEAMRAE